MKFTQEKKNSIMMYMLEKIKLGEMNVSKNVAETFNISRNTVNQYLNELQNKNIIRKVKRDQYEIVIEIFSYCLQRSKNELSSDTYAFDHCLAQHIQDCTEEARRIWTYAFSEMTNNVMDHSEAEMLLIHIRKSYFSIKVALADNGVGIFEKIKEHFALDSLEEAICELSKGKLTTDKKNHSGEGIFFSSRMMDAFAIFSGGKVYRTDKYKSDMVADIEQLDTEGTTVMMELSNFTHRRIRDVFDEYSSEDGNFSKTKIPLRSIFDSAPVSRSQAKRLCNRLEQFEEVTIDFDGMDWMGQAFAHQLFVVYQNQHPNMIIKPVNMNEDVELIYKHVIQTK